MNAPFSSSRAYLIGIANYQHRSWQLATPLSDAESLAALLRAQQGFETTVLHDPTAAQIQALFSQIQRENQAEDARVLIYYAGHGVQRDSAQGLKGYFLPVDARPGDDGSMVPMEDLSEALRAVQARHLLLVLDCCFAGTFRMPTKRSIMIDRLNAPLRRQHFDIFCNFPSRLVLSSTSHRQKALDRLEDGDVHSPFNRFLRQAIRGDADYTRDRLITASELKTYLSDKVSRITGASDSLQSVGLDSLEGDGEGEFLFFLNGFDAAQLPEQAYVNPYKGLQSYDQGDAALFFGRQKATHALLEKANTQSFVMVVGASGTGKSSLVKAGLLPRLSGQRIAVVRPGKHPISSIPDEQLWDTLVVDQWEELVTQAADPQETLRFHAEIRRLIDHGKRIIGTVRADFEAQARHEMLEPYWTIGRFVVPPFTSEEYHDVIVQPAKRVACLFEDTDLVQQIEQEVAQQPGPLPLLSFMLTELFERAKNESSRYREIKRKHYEAVGGVSGALRNKAEAVYAGLPDDAHRDTMRRMMLRMVSLSAGEMAGRRVLLRELDYNDGAEDQRIATVTERLDESKLIRRDVDDAQRRFIEPAHDALVRAWKRLWDWLRALGEENLLLHLKLAGDVEEHRAKQAGKKFLWHENPRLDQVVALMKNEPLMLNEAESAFALASVAEKMRLRRLFITVGSIIAVVIVAAMVLAWIKNGEAQVSLKAAQESQKMAEKRLRDFEVADSIRLVESRKKEKLNFDKYLADGDQFVKSFDYGLALRKYHNADSLFKLYLSEDANAGALGDSLRRKIAACEAMLGQGG